MLEALKRSELNLGNRLAAISTARLPDLKRDFDREGIDTSPYFSFEPEADLGFEASSVLIVALPSPLASATFTIDGQKKSVIIPPTYENRGEIVDATLQRLSDALSGEGFHIAPARRLPLKPTAVRSGIGKFGRNNTAYVDGMGSFANLLAFYSDLPVDGEVFYPLARMEACDDCARCAEQCPTGAISRDRLLIDAERCLTMWNEHGGEFPDWIDPKWHNALVGCTRCQVTCPQNAAYLRTVEVAAYNDAQTKDFLNGKLPEELLKPLGFPFSSEIFARNLKALEGLA